MLRYVHHVLLTHCVRQTSAPLQLPQGGERDRLNKAALVHRALAISVHTVPMVTWMISTSVLKQNSMTSTGPSLSIVLHDLLDCLCFLESARELQFFIVGSGSVVWKLGFAFCPCKRKVDNFNFGSPAAMLLLSVLR